jgi:hypothetical protein
MIDATVGDRCVLQRLRSSDSFPVCNLLQSRLIVGRSQQNWHQCEAALLQAVQAQNSLLDVHDPSRLFPWLNVHIPAL